MVHITAGYAGLIGLILIALSIRVIRYRHSTRIGLGDGKDKELVRRMRVQANCAEYAPMGLLLIGFAEAQGAWPLLVHAMGAAFLAGRILHPLGMSRTPEDFRFRVSGMALTLTTISTAAAVNIALALF